MRRYELMRERPEDKAWVWTHVEAVDFHDAVLLGLAYVGRYGGRLVGVNWLPFEYVHPADKPIETFNPVVKKTMPTSPNARANEYEQTNGERT